MARLKSDASSIAFKEIKNRINKYDLMPGDTISDLAISEELNMSRTPVREAIFNLIQYNLVEKKKTKFVVKSISIEDIKEILQLREALETKACELIIDNGGLCEEQKEKLKLIELKLSNSLDVKDYFDNFKYDSQFHHSLVEFCNNSRIMTTMDNITTQGERLRLLSILTPLRYKDAIEEHQEIIKAIENGDKAKVKECIEDHLERTINNYLKITKDNSWDHVIISFKKAFSKI